ncbi:MAG: hypothetical protein VCA12_06750, partial [Pseudomonadales bacterium]
IKQAGNRSDSILRLSIEKPCYNSYPQSNDLRAKVLLALDDPVNNPAFLQRRLREEISTAIHNYPQLSTTK